MSGFNTAVYVLDDFEPEETFVHIDSRSINASGQIKRKHALVLQKRMHQSATLYNGKRLSAQF